MSETAKRLRIERATGEDREMIYGLRHAVYARELGQHPENAGGRLRDGLDDFNEYLVVKAGDEIVGFVSITPPGHGRYSVDKYLDRTDLPFPVDDALYEVRLLTVCPGYRRSPVAALLLYAAFRFVEEQGGTRIIAIGRREVMDLYVRVGLRLLGRTIRSGAVTYELMSVTVDEIRAAVARFAPLLRRLERGADWRLPFAFRGAGPCPHGGAFWDAIGPDFTALERRSTVINADVLDAWFDPAPGVGAALREHLPWLLRTAPPAHSEGLVAAIAEARAVPPESLIAGAGSSSLIYLALPRWLTPASRVLLPAPTYGEYAHLLGRVLGCRVDRMPLPRADAYRLDPHLLEQHLQRARYDLIVLVNPNNPTGGFVPPAALEPTLRRVPPETRVWVDEAYVDYVGPGASIERFAAGSRNVFVCKSLSKGLALSGARAAYLVGPPTEVAALRTLTPPWAVSLPAQVAAVAALRDPEYYARRYAETHALRRQFACQLRQAIPGIDVLPGAANWVLCHLPPEGPDAATVCHRCREKGVFLRDLSALDPSPGSHAVRIAVKNEADNRRITEILTEAGRQFLEGRCA
jgi:histidinol-phosphate/aromatic aminotransferase/cobyric acid decarboxylase-like protein/ribosomal protein S18 acetylase RimI-like enzyme